MTDSITPMISDRICKHMNEDHIDALILYAKVFGKLPEVTHAEMLSIDELGMNLQVDSVVNHQPIRIEFDHPLKDAEDAHHTLIDMLKTARKTLT